MTRCPQTSMVDSAQCLLDEGHEDYHEFPPTEADVARLSKRRKEGPVKEKSIPRGYIYIRSDRGYWPCLDGKDLEEGERLIITFEDGFERGILVRLQSETIGQREPVSNVRAYWYERTMFHGREMLHVVNLEGMKARRA